jgi:hypothetical protein
MPETENRTEKKPPNSDRKNPHRKNGLAGQTMTTMAAPWAGHESNARRGDAVFLGLVW